MTFPQRIGHFSPPGSLLKSAGRREAAPAQDAKEIHTSDAEYLKLVRQLPCLKCGHQPCGEAAHVKFSSAAFGMKNQIGKRVDDSRALPLCRDDHQNAKDAQHRQNEEAFWADIDIVPYQVTRALYAAAPDLVAMENVIRFAISQRRR